VSTKSESKADTKEQFDFNVALRRLVYMAGLGCVLIFIYGLSIAQASRGNFGSFASVGLMAAGAAIVSGGLLGFLFGVPHTREGESPQPEKEKRDGTIDQDGESGPVEPSTSYRPNTSLEQISDWLTKMLVGVGLIEIKIIPEKLRALASYIAKGLGDSEQSQAFALVLLIFFAVCGFVFGFLWARLFLKKWFTEADQVRLLGEKVDRLQQRQMADAQAFAMITHELNRGRDDPRADPENLARVIKAASSPLKAQIFNQAKEASGDRDAHDYDIKLQGAISIFQGLIADDIGNRFHLNHSELAYAMSRQNPPDYGEAEKEITRAMEIRNSLGNTGWKYYEFRRACYRIKQDQNFKNNVPSEPSAAEKIIGDLRIACTEVEKWQNWNIGDKVAAKWMGINNVDVPTLRQPAKKLG
jgi:hypothetical protein